MVVLKVGSRLCGGGEGGGEVVGHHSMHAAGHGLNKLQKQNPLTLCRVLSATV